MRWESEDDAALLRALGIKPGAVVAREPMAGGMSGARLERLTMRVGEGMGMGMGVDVDVDVGSTAVYSYPCPYQRRVVKRLEPAAGWLGALSGDTQLREVRLWSRGMLRDLPAGIETGVLGWTEVVNNDSDVPSKRGALLLRDERGHLMRDPIRTPPGHLPGMVVGLVDALARLHARFWDDPRLRDAELGLVTPQAALLLVAPEAVARRVASGDSTAYLPRMLAGWEAFFRLAAPQDAVVLRGVLADPAPVVEALARLPWTLVHGDVWGPNLGMLPPGRHAPRRGRRVLLLDWALATAGPATYDPLWLCGTWHELAPVRVLAAYRARLMRHLAARGIALAPKEWRALADAGYLRTALTCGEALGWAATGAPAGISRRRAETRARWWAARGARAARRIVW